MSRKKIYSTELKLEIMKRYQKGESLRTPAQKYHVNEGNIQKWKAAYVKQRIERLTTIHGTYSEAFRVYVIEYMYHTGASLRQTAAYFNIPSMSTVRSWEQIYCEKGKEALH